MFPNRERLAQLYSERKEQETPKMHARRPNAFKTPSYPLSGMSLKKIKQAITPVCHAMPSCFAILGGARAPLGIFRAMLDDPRMTLDIVKRNPLLGIQNEQL